MQVLAINSHTEEGKLRCEKNGKAFKKATHSKHEIRKTLEIEEYNSNPKTCPVCSTPIEFTRKNNKFCSKSCSATHTNEMLKQRGYKYRKSKNNKFLGA